MNELYLMYSNEFNILSIECYVIGQEMVLFAGQKQR